ncbi:MAG TPA: RNA polymerase sporulation sigma factor SigK [Candidatus Eisenbergiella merdigallinarum]|uniref:RNA polymerase sigma factor n=1 Tax=Candidatus Eisenbergiella merdigallinarum TaxID=2838552 RepID=A0A9D2SBW8_9FIRM|nr:RNA polymerase sporulation sigma factor SigK [Candidatus Eisenbergiella merdigallinarum]
MKTFQKPLSKEEESLCIRALQDGDAGRRSEAKRLLIERNLRLVAHIARKYTNVDEDMEDLISIGTIGLIKAVDSFDLHKNSRLASYAARCIDNELLMMLRGKKKTSREVSLFEPIGTDREGNEISLLDVMEQEQPDIVEEMEKARCLSQLYGLMDTELSAREREVLTLRYGLAGGREVTQKEIGEKLGISRSYVSRIEKKALGKMRAGFLKMEASQPRNRA